MGFDERYWHVTLPMTFLEKFFSLASTAYVLFFENRVKGSDIVALYPEECN
jgi:hypothetical protein